MTGLVQGISLSVSLLILFVVIELIRRNRLKERYSLTWLATSIVLIVFSSSRLLLHRLAGAVGIFYPPSLIFIVAILFVLVLLLHVSMVISELYEKNKRLTQELGIMKMQLKEMTEDKQGRRS